MDIIGNLITGGIFLGIAVWALNQLWHSLNKRMDKQDERLSSIHLDVIEAKNNSQRALEEILVIDENLREMKANIQGIKTDISNHTDTLRNFKKLVIVHNDKISYLEKVTKGKKPAP